MAANLLAYTPFVYVEATTASWIFEAGSEIRTKAYVELSHLPHCVLVRGAVALATPAPRSTLTRFARLPSRAGDVGIGRGDYDVDAWPGDVQGIHRD